MKKNLLVIFVISMVILQPLMIVFATDSVDDSELTAAELVAQAQTVTNEINSTRAAISALENQEASLKKEIATAESDIKKKQKTLERNMSLIKERLCAMYMFDTESFMEVVFSSTDFVELISHAEAVLDILKSDYQMLDDLEALEEEITSMENDCLTKTALVSVTEESIQEKNTQIQALETERDTLLERSESAKQTYENLQKVANTASSESSSAATSQSSQSDSDSSFSETSSTGGSQSSGVVASSGNACSSLSDEDFDFVCAVVAHEGGTSYEGSLAVISCVMNRCDVGWGGTDPVSVLTAPGQFSSYFDGYYKKFLGADIPETRQAVIDCVENGIRSHRYLSFRSYETEGSVNICGNWYFNEM